MESLSGLAIGGIVVALGYHGTMLFLIMNNLSRLRTTMQEINTELLRHTLTSRVK